jgi:hypothetical protein
MKSTYTKLHLPTRAKSTRAAAVDPTSKQVVSAAMPAMPLRRTRVVPILSADRPAEDYRDPARVLERRQFIEFGCGACQHHQRKPDLSAYHCAIGIRQWPDGTNSSCRGFIRRSKTRPSTQTK